MTVLERDVRNQIVTALRGIGAKVAVLHIGAFASVGEPDLIGCYRSVAFALEVKRPKKPAEHTPRQKSRLREWQAAGAVTGVVTSPAGAVRMVRRGTGRRHRAEYLGGVPT